MLAVPPVHCAPRPATQPVITLRPPSPSCDSGCNRSLLWLSRSAPTEKLAQAGSRDAARRPGCVIAATAPGRGGAARRCTARSQQRGRYHPPARQPRLGLGTLHAVARAPPLDLGASSSSHIMAGGACAPLPTAGLGAARRGTTECACTCRFARQATPMLPRPGSQPRPVNPDSLLARPPRARTPRNMHPQPRPAGHATLAPCRGTFIRGCGELE